MFNSSSFKAQIKKLVEQKGGGEHTLQLTRSRSSFRTTSGQKTDMIQCALYFLILTQNVNMVEVVS